MRALCKLFDEDWLTMYDRLTDTGREMYDMPSSNAVWGAYLYDEGFNKYIVKNSPEHMITVREFAGRNPVGRYLLATGSHVVAVKDGDYYDTWDSGDEVPIYYWRR